LKAFYFFTSKKKKKKILPLIFIRISETVVEETQAKIVSSTEDKAVDCRGGKGRK